MPKNKVKPLECLLVVMGNVTLDVFSSCIRISKGYVYMI